MDIAQGRDVAQPICSASFAVLALLFHSLFVAYYNLQHPVLIFADLSSLLESNLRGDDGVVDRTMTGSVKRNAMATAVSLTIQESKMILRSASALEDDGGAGWAMVAAWVTARRLLASQR